MIWRFVFCCTCGLQGKPLVMRAAPSLYTALEQNKTLTSFTLAGMLCSGVCSVQVIGVLWCKCSGAVITGRSFSRLPFGSGHCGLHHCVLHCGSCLPRTPPPPPNVHIRDVCDRRAGLCDCLHGFALTKQQKERCPCAICGRTRCNVCDVALRGIGRCFGTRA